MTEKDLCEITTTKGPFVIYGRGTLEEKRVMLFPFELEGGYTVFNLGPREGHTNLNQSNFEQFSPRNS